MKKKVIGVTGIIGSGKTTVANMFADRFKITVIDTDQIVADLYNNSVVKIDLERIFGVSDKQQIRQLIFSHEITHSSLSNSNSLAKSPHNTSSSLSYDSSSNMSPNSIDSLNTADKLNQLEEMLHPLVLEEIKRQLTSINDANDSGQSPFVVLVVPLLFRSLEFLKLVDQVLLIHCSNLCDIIERVLKRAALKQHVSSDTLYVLNQMINKQSNILLQYVCANDIIFNHNNLNIDALVSMLYKKYSS